MTQESDIPDVNKVVKGSLGNFCVNVIHVNRSKMLYILWPGKDFEQTNAKLLSLTCKLKQQSKLGIDKIKDATNEDIILDHEHKMTG